MKKTSFFPVLLPILLVSAFPGIAHAQFFKQLLNSVKNTAQNRANDKASQTTNQGLDKVDGATQIKSTSGSSGTSTAGSAGATSPGVSTGSSSRSSAGDTSAANATMKALGLWTAGGGVSAADSVAAIRSFMTASGGSGIFYQYQTVITSKKGNSRDTSNSYLAANGNGRSEMRINMPGVSSGKIINIGHATQRQYSVMLDPDDKTYSLNVIDTSLINSGGGENYQVTKIGNETVHGYPCIHSKMVSTIGSGLFKSKSTMDIWTSTAVPGYALYKKLGSIENVKPKMMAALDNAGAGGFFVKMVAGDKDYTMTMSLVQAEEKTFPGSLFQIPAGYKQSNETMTQHMLSGAKKQ